MAKKPVVRPTGLSEAMSAIQKDFGTGAVVRMGDAPTESIDVIPTGVASLDVALGRGGLPRGRIIEIYGPESSGKTTVSLLATASAQKSGGTVAFVDVEHALDPEYAATLGVNVDDLIFAQPNSAEQALSIAERLIASEEVSLVVVDSVAALVPQPELDGEMGDAHVGLQARLMSQALRKMAGIAKASNTAVIFINQLREKVGVLYGSPEITSGGKALKFYASVRIDVRSQEPITEKSQRIGEMKRFKIVKNKVAPPFKEAFARNIYGEGIDTVLALVEEAGRQGVIEKAGGWYKYQGESMRGAEIAELIRTDEKFKQELYDQTMNAFFERKKAEQAEREAKRKKGAEEEVPEGVDPETGEITDEAEWD